MYITCPNCSTSYNVDGGNIGESGRTVRCFNCEHSWHQFPVAVQSTSGTSSARYTVPPPPPPHYYAPPPYVGPQAYGHTYGYPPQAPPQYPTYPGALQPPPQAATEALDMPKRSLDPVPGSGLESNLASRADPDTNFEDIPLTEPDDDIKPEPDGDADSGNLPTDDELEAMFGEDDEK